MKRLLFIILICLGGCVSPRQYLRDRLQDSQDKQEQRKFNAEVLRRMEDGIYQDMRDLQTRIIALEKKMEERKPCASSSSIRALNHYPEIPVTQERPCIPVLMSNPPKCKDQERPNYPCFLCDGMVPK